VIGVSEPITDPTTVRLVQALRDAAAAHGVHETEIGHPDEDWPSWYAVYMIKSLGDDGYHLTKSP
jgi:hypothetical protein